MSHIQRQFWHLNHLRMWRQNRLRTCHILRRVENRRRRCKDISRCCLQWRLETDIKCIKKLSQIKSFLVVSICHVLFYWVMYWIIRNTNTQSLLKKHFLHRSKRAFKDSGHPSLNLTSLKVKTFDDGSIKPVLEKHYLLRRWLAKNRLWKVPF